MISTEEPHSPITSFQTSRIINGLYHTTHTILAPADITIEASC